MRAANGTLNRTLRTMLLSLVIVGGISSGSALARTIIVEIAPPPARVEVVPEMRRGYTWAPGYWSWNRDRHVWVNGRTIRARTGYAWAGRTPEAVTSSAPVAGHAIRNATGSKENRTPIEIVSSIGS